MPMTEQELKNWEQRLVEERREILERDRANKIEKEAIEQAKKKLASRSDADRVDYLFDAINANRNVYVRVEEPIRIQHPKNDSFAVAAFFASMATFVVGLVCLVLHLI